MDVLRVLVTIAVFTPLIFGCEGQDGSGENQITAIVGATVIDGTGGPPILDATIVVDSDSIIAIGPSREIKPPEFSRIVDASDRWIVPGMIDLHAHFYESGRPGAQPTFVVDLTKFFPYDEEIAWMKARVPYTLSRYICAGVTSVVALGAIPWEHDVRELADATEAAPRVFLAGGVIANYPPEEGSPVWDGIQTGHWIAHPDEAPELVRTLEATGIDLIKAGYIPRPDRTIEVFEPSLTALIAESHARNLPVSVHANGLAEAKMVLRAGTDILAHTVRDREVDEEFLRLAVSHRVINTSSIGVPRGFSRLPHHRVELSDPELICGDSQVVESWEKWASIPEEERPTLPSWFQGWESSEQTMIANIEKLNNAGIRIAVGTDGGNIGTMHGASFHNELQHLAKAGLSPMEIIVAATRNGAEALGMEDELGTLEANKLADLVILSANPLTDIANLNQITQVMVRGNLIDRDPLVLPSNR